LSALLGLARPPVPQGLALLPLREGAFIVSRGILTFGGVALLVVWLVFVALLGAGIAGAIL
jgi:hypothetical protein